MSAILNNPWVVGIGGGILSGLFVAIITRALFSRRDRSEYVQKLNRANSEVLYAIRPGVSEGVIPKREVVESLIQATARKYSVDAEDMYDTRTLADELVKEVMDSSFISAGSKADFCEKLTPFKSVPEQQTAERPEPAREYQVMAKYRRQTVAILSMMVGVLTATMGVFAALQTDGLKPDQTLLMLVLPAVVSVFAALFVRILKDLKAQAMRVHFLGTEITFREKKDEVAEPDGAANGSQPIRSETNPTSSAAGSRR